MDPKPYIHRFEASVEEIELPEQFTFPFYYEPHLLVQMAAEQLQRELSKRDFGHNFGLDGNDESTAVGKMFGVLVIKDHQGHLGFLAAFSGKIADSNHHQGFVPPVFDLLDAQGYFIAGENELNTLNRQIEQLENSDQLKEARTFLASQKKQSDVDIAKLKDEIKSGKAQRKQKRQEAQANLTEEEFAKLDKELSEASMREQLTLKDCKKYWKHHLQAAEDQVKKLTDTIKQLKEKRKQKSARLQERLFSDYSFLDARGESRSLLSIFSEKELPIPPAGAGECAAPRLLHFAYQHELTPIAMGEFWWGASPQSEVRTHGQFYPACRSKCEPILGHMLQGLDVEKNPMLSNPTQIGDLPVVYEDEHLLVVNKPAEFLSIPGKNVFDSVYTRMEARYPGATGPLLVHRLDMSTSGLLLVAKTKNVHQQLQAQFLKRSVTKRYEAVLDGLLDKDSGEINLPLRVDLDNRPQQLVCCEHGKKAITKWHKIKEVNGQTLVHFYPITGRTHQLRVHAAHASGLGTPIVGDDLYGKRDKRLYLHAAYLKFQHPVTSEVMELSVSSGFLE
ncbi:pseudouridine synthase [Marinoscillum sp.]|uniref:RluA family pseudouridine synthase n=1 Tax=Marinoscillum sp. TaxID=2024838 RepID=UPI003BA97F5C